MRPSRLRHRVTAVLPAAAGLAALTVGAVISISPSDAATTATTATATTATTTAASTNATTTATTAASTNASTNASSCDRAPWGWRVQGSPKSFSGGDRGGDYLWHSTDGFHLRVTHRTDERVVYSGVIHSSAALTMDPVRLEAGDVAKLSADRRTLVFAFANHGHVDGVNFHTNCAARLTVSRLNAGSAKLPADRVYLGALGVHPAQVPFTLHRIQAG